MFSALVGLIIASFVGLAAVGASDTDYSDIDNPSSLYVRYGDGFYLNAQYVIDDYMAFPPNTDFLTSSMPINIDFVYGSSVFSTDDLGSDFYGYSYQTIDVSSSGLSYSHYDVLDDLLTSGDVTWFIMFYPYQPVDENYMTSVSLDLSFLNLSSGDHVCVLFEDVGDDLYIGNHYYYDVNEEGYVWDYCTSQVVDVTMRAVNGVPDERMNVYLTSADWDLSRLSVSYGCVDYTGSTTLTGNCLVVDFALATSTFSVHVERPDLYEFRKAYLVSSSWLVDGFDRYSIDLNGVDVSVPSDSVLRWLIYRSSAVVDDSVFVYANEYDLDYDGSDIDFFWWKYVNDNGADDPMDAIADGLGIVDDLGVALVNGFNGVAMDTGNNTINVIMTFAFVLMGIGVSFGIVKKVWRWITSRHGM